MLWITPWFSRYLPVRRDRGSGGEPGCGWGGVSRPRAGQWAGSGSVGSYCLSYPIPALPLPLLCLLPPPALYKVGFPGQGMRCWGDACSSRGWVDPRRASPGPRAGAPSPLEVPVLPAIAPALRCCLQLLLPFSAQAGFPIVLRLTNCFGVSLSLLFTTREVSMQQKFLLEMKDWHFVLLPFTLFLLFWS